MTHSKTRAMGRRSLRRIPGGTQLLSKRPEMFAPGQWPSHYRRARGATIWDLDDNKYVDMSLNGVGANVLGYCDPDVDAAARAAIRSGSMSTLNAPEEVELAELLCKIHPWAEQVRYARTGGEAMAIAVRIARAHTGKDVVAFCGYHGWHDWYLSANLGGDSLGGHLLSGLEARGVPAGLRGTSFPFRFNEPQDLETIVAAQGSRLAAIVLEPARSQEPTPVFLRAVREAAERTGAVVIFDEVSAAMRLTTGGIHMKYGAKPDIAVFAKAISNGYPMAAILGRRQVMEAAQTTFISSTNWTERIGPATALATLAKHRRLNVPKKLVALGRSIQDGWKRLAQDAGLPLRVDGIPPLSHFSIQDPRALALTTLFTQEMLRKGFLAGANYYATFAHRDSDVRQYLEACADSFKILSAAMGAGDVERRLRGPVKHAGFQRLA